MIRKLSRADDVTLKILVSGGHLAPSQGETWREIANDGFAIDEKVEILSNQDDEVAICEAAGRGVGGFGLALQRLLPDIFVILGDRYEALAAAFAASILHIPIAHLHGGETTLGANDEVFRHAITKMSHVHFVSAETYRRRVVQMGEIPEMVFNFGALGVENALKQPLLTPEETRRRLRLDGEQQFLLVTFHPATLERSRPDAQAEILLRALDAFPDHVKVLTGANADAGGSAINHVFRAWAEAKPDKYRFSSSLGSTLYLSSMRIASAAIGNSSSGIIEAPSFRIPSVDIGSRQEGRVRADSVLWSPPEEFSIVEATKRALSQSFRTLVSRCSNPYQGLYPSRDIAEKLRTISLDRLAPKRFHDIA